MVLNGMMLNREDQPPPLTAYIPLCLELQYAGTGELVSKPGVMTTQMCKLSPDVPGRVRVEFRLKT